MDAPVAPAGILAGQAQNEQPDGPHSAGPAWAPGAGPGCVAAGQQVAVPSQHRAGADQQPDPVGQAAGEAVQQGGQEYPVRSGEPRPGGAGLPLQDVIWCRTTKISPSLSRSLIGSSRSNPNTPVTLR
jgi:hypothetical protein